MRVNRCIERKIFDDTIVEIAIRGQNFTKLDKDSIRHLIKLKNISIIDSQTASIEKGAFRNLPGLTHVYIGYNPLKKIKTGVFSSFNIEELRINNNEIETISDGAFSNMSQLVEFYANNNRIEYFDREWFLDSPDLRLINLQFNKLHNIPKNAFYHNSNLKDIRFDFNEIDAIQEDAFKGLNSLTYLGLRFNRIKEMSVNIFPQSLAIKTLMISANKLNYLPYELLERILVQELKFSGNPWKCPCLERIEVWAHSKNVSILASKHCVNYGIPICSAPQTYSRTCLETYDPDSTQIYYNAVLPLKGSLLEFCVRFD